MPRAALLLRIAVIAALSGASVAVVADEPLRVFLAVASAPVPLGGDVSAEVTVRNAGSAPVRIPVLRLDARSVAFDLAFRDAGGKERTAVHDVVAPDAFVAPRVKLPTATLPPGAAVVQRFDLPAVRTGTLRIRARFASSSSEEAVVEIVPADGKTTLAASVETSMGAFVIDLRPDAAPNTVMNFVNLARSGFYEGIVFHRVVTGFVIQAGNPNVLSGGYGTDGPGWTVHAEFGDEKHVEGSVAMARIEGNADSAGSQFYICLAPQPRLDRKYTVFGRVIEGMDVVKAIAGSSLRPKSQRPVDDVIIRTVRIEPR